MRITKKNSVERNSLSVSRAFSSVSAGLGLTLSNFAPREILKFYGFQQEPLRSFDLRPQANAEGSSAPWEAGMQKSEPHANRKSGQGKLKVTF